MYKSANQTQFLRKHNRETESPSIFPQDLNLNSRMSQVFGSRQRLASIPKNLQQKRRYEIGKENQRLIDAISQIQPTVTSHIWRKDKAFRCRPKNENKWKEYEIRRENYRLYRALTKVKSVKRLKTLPTSSTGSPKVDKDKLDYLFRTAKAKKV